MGRATLDFFKFGWSLLTWLTFSALIAALVGGVYYYHRADDELRTYVQAKLAEHYPHLAVNVANARLIQGEGIRLRQVSFVQPAARSNSARNEIAYIDEIVVRCSPGLNDLLHGQLAVDRVIVRGLTLHATRQADGNWNIAKLFPLPEFGKPPRNPPPVTIERGTIEIVDRSVTPARVLTLDDMLVELKTKRLLAPGTVTTRGFLIAFDGRALTDHCRKIELQGVARTTDKAWSVAGNLEGLKWSQDLLNALPHEAANHLQRFEEFQTRANLAFHVAQASANAELKYKIDGTLFEGNWLLAGVQQHVSNVQAEFTVDNAGCEVRDLNAQLGDGQVSLRLQTQGHDRQSPFTMSVSTTRIPITMRLIESLPPDVQELWGKYRPLGEVSGRLDLGFDGSQWQCDADLNCHNVSFQHEKLQYPVTECQGTVRLRQQALQIDLVGLAGSTPITVKGQVDHPGPDMTGWWEVKSTRLKSVDDALIEALPPKTKKLLRDLQLRGNFGFWARFERDDPQRPVGPPHLIVALDNGWVNYVEFPYPISEIRGQIEWKDGRWDFQNLQGWNDGCRIECSGTWLPTEHDRPLSLRFVATDVTLDAELKRALRPQVRRLWTDLNPQGTLQYAVVEFLKTDSSAKPMLDIQAIQRPASAATAVATNLQFYPHWFPYRIDQVTGSARWFDGTLTVRDFTGQHGATRVAANLGGRIEDNGTWEVSVTDLRTDRLKIDEELVSVMPPSLSDPIRNANGSGLLTITGAVRFGRSKPIEPVWFGWDLDVHLEQARFGNLHPLEQIYGKLHLKGQAVEGQAWSSGSIAIDSMMCHNIQLTQVAGPIWLDRKRIAIGTRVPTPPRDGQLRPVVANVFGGRVSFDGELNLDADAQFILRTHLTSADVASIARDHHLGRGNLSGQAYLELFLTGSALGAHTLKGNGSAQLRNANLYESPLILAILSRLSTGKSDNAAFTSSDVAFHIRANHIYFDRFDLTGDAITLKGIGEMSLQRELNLDFYSIVGTEQRWSPLVRPFVGEASRRFMLIHVDGTLAEPITTQEVLPGLNETLQQLFPEQSTGVPPETAGRRFPSRLGQAPRGNSR